MMKASLLGILTRDQATRGSNVFTSFLESDDKEAWSTCEQEPMTGVWLFRKAYICAQVVIETDQPDTEEQAN